MISRKEGMNIAGQVMIEKLGRNYIEKNKEKLSTMRSVDDNILSVDLYIDTKPPKSIHSPDGGIQVDDSVFPDFVIGVEVDLSNGNTKIIEE